MVVGGVGGSPRGRFLFPFRHRQHFQSASHGWGVSCLMNRKKELIVLQDYSERCITKQVEIVVLYRFVVWR